MRVDFFWHSYKYLPYEQKLARRELTALMHKRPVIKPYGLSIQSSKGWEKIAIRTTYFREATSHSGHQVIPLQAILENSINNFLKHKVPSKRVTPIIRRQSTRYSAHGLHEYRGKFNPQIVRAIGNVIGLQLGEWILDPFCGSGTTLLEAAHVGWNAIGVDLNPLGVQIARAKIAAMHVNRDKLLTSIETLKRRFSKKFYNTSFTNAFSSRKMREIGGKTWQNSLPDFDYLSRWFTESVLVQLSIILNEIDNLPHEEIRLIHRVILSDILREVSLQDPADLRIRRRKSTPENSPAIPLYLNSLLNKITTILEARKHLPKIKTTQDALLGDSRKCVAIIKAHKSVKKSRQFHAAITSPPYATALPYIDTQRLSLVILGLVKAHQIHSTEKMLIGSREITTCDYLKTQKSIETNAYNLPSECASVCQKLMESLDISRDGFRRKNVPSLTYKYLVDMMSVFREVRQLLRPRGKFALLVGRNKTRLGNRTWIIDTPRLLSLIAEHSGFEVEECVELETYQRFDVHKNNSIRSESLLILRSLPNED